MPFPEKLRDAAWMAAENGILQPAVGPAAERRAAAKAAALTRASVMNRTFRRDSLQKNVSSSIAADGSISRNPDDPPTTSPIVGAATGLVSSRSRDAPVGLHTGRSSHLSYSGPQPGPFHRASDCRPGGDAPARHHSFSGPQSSHMRRTVGAVPEAPYRREASTGSATMKANMRSQLAQMERVIGLPAMRRNARRPISPSPISLAAKGSAVGISQPGNGLRDLKRLTNGGSSGRSAHAKVMLWDDALVSEAAAAELSPPASPVPGEQSGSIAVRVFDASQLPLMVQRRDSHSLQPDPDRSQPALSHRAASVGYEKISGQASRSDVKQQTALAPQPGGASGVGGAMAAMSMEALPGSDATRLMDQQTSGNHIAQGHVPARSMEGNGYLRSYSRPRTAILTAQNLVGLEPRRDKRQDPQERLLLWLSDVPSTEATRADRSYTSFPCNNPMIEQHSPSGKQPQSNQHQQQQEEQQQQQQREQTAQPQHQRAESVDKTASGVRHGNYGRREKGPASTNQTRGCGGSSGSSFIQSLFGCFGYRGHNDISGRRRNATQPVTK